jgi:hypothetical protein
MEFNAREENSKLHQPISLVSPKGDLSNLEFFQGKVDGGCHASEDGGREDPDGQPQQPGGQPEVGRTGSGILRLAATCQLLVQFLQSTKNSDDSMTTMRTNQSLTLTSEVFQSS